MKIFKSRGIKIFIFCLAILLCFPFFAQINTNKKAQAEKDILEDISLINISSSANANRVKNNSLVMQGTIGFIDGYIYSPKQNDNAKNQTIILSTSGATISTSKSLFLWVFIPSIIVQNLVIVASDNNSNSLMWQMSGTAYSDSCYDLSLTEMINSYNGTLSRGWKLLELSVSDAKVVGGSEFEIEMISINAGYNNDFSQDDDANFCVFYPFVATKTVETTSIVDHQEYVVYAEKENFLNLTQSIYVGDSVEISSIKDFFSYVVVGNQNILQNQTGYAWNVSLTKPTGSAKTLTFDKKLEIVFDETGYYLIDISLTTSSQDFYALISENYNIYAEDFVFGYFQKTEFDVINGSQNLIVFTFSDDFAYDETQPINIEFSNKNLLSATYYIDNGKVYITMSAKDIGKSTLSLSLSGTKLGEAETQIYTSKINININEQKENNFILLWIIFGILMVGFVVYLVISFVKARRFGVK